MFDIFRLSLLLGNNYDYFISEISKIGIISGSSLLYCFDDYVDPNEIGDVDIYFNNIENFVKALRLIQQIDHNSKLCSCTDYAYCRAVGISTLYIRKFGKKPLNLIYLDFKDPTDFLNYTNMDYLQCAWFDGKLYKTDLFEQALESRIVKHYSLDTKLSKLIKASKKGYKLKILTSSTKNPDNDYLPCHTGTFCNLRYKNISYNDNAIILDYMGNITEIILVKMTIEKNVLTNIYDLKFEEMIEKYHNYSYCDLFDVASVSYMYDRQNFINLTTSDNIKHKIKNGFVYENKENPIYLGTNKFLLRRYPCTDNYDIMSLINDNILTFSEISSSNDCSKTLHFTEPKSYNNKIHNATNIFLYNPEQKDVNGVINHVKTNYIDHLYINLKNLSLPIEKIKVRKISLLFNFREHQNIFMYLTEIKEDRGFEEYFENLHKFFNINCFEEIIFHCYEFKDHCQKLVRECFLTSKFSIPFNSDIYDQDIKDLCIASHQFRKIKSARSLVI